MADNNDNNNLNNRPKRKATQFTYKDGKPIDRTLSVTEINNNNKRQRLQHQPAMSTIIYQALRISVKQALNGEYSTETKEAKEFLKNLVRSFMFIKHKTKANGEYDKTKARLVGDGKHQHQDTYDMISSSTVAIQAVLLLFNIASKLKAKLSSYDVKGAFLNALYDEEEPTFMIIGKETASIWTQIDPTATEFITANGELILQLDKYIYGLKQSPLKFQLHLKQTLLNLGYQQCDMDECIYVKHQNNHISILSTHVDDILQASTSDELTAELNDHLIKTYKTITFHKNVESYLGMVIEQSQDNATINLSQQGFQKSTISKYQHIISVYGKANNNSVNTPAADNLFDDLPDESSSSTSKTTNDQTIQYNKQNEFLRVIMSLMYLARITRPDILLPVTYLATRTHIATTNDYKKLARILQYINNTQALTLTIKCDDLQLHAYCDASYGCHNDGKSHTGYYIAMGRNNNSYLTAKSAKQKLTAISSTDAEILALTDVTKTTIWLHNLIKEICNKANLSPELYITPTIVYQDNKSAILLVSQQTKQRRSRHILIKTTFIKEQILRGIITLRYLSTDTMTADMLTKPLQGQLYYKHRHKIFNNKLSNN